MKDNLGWVEIIRKAHFSTCEQHWDSAMAILSRAVHSRPSTRRSAGTGSWEETDAETVLQPTVPLRPVPTKGAPTHK